MENEEKIMIFKKRLEDKLNDFLDEKINLDKKEQELKEEKKLSDHRSTLLDQEAQKIAADLKKDEELLQKMQLEAKDQKDNEELGKKFIKKL